MPKPDDTASTARFADMLTAMGTQPRLRIVRLLLSAHPAGLIVGDIGAELQITGSTLSHHLEKLRNEGLVTVRPAAGSNQLLAILRQPVAGDVRTTGQSYEYLLAFPAH